MVSLFRGGLREFFVLGWLCKLGVIMFNYSGSRDFSGLFMFFL